MMPLRIDAAALAGLLLCATSIAFAHDASHSNGGHVGHGAPQIAATSAGDPIASHFGGPFRLIDQTGKPVTDADYRGRYMLIYFGFTHCGDTCPIDLAVMGQALDMVGVDIASKIQPLFISVDPEVDTPKVLADYTPNFHPRLIGLTGSLPEVEAAAKAYHVQRHMILHQATNGHPYFVDHGSLMFLMGPDGAFVSLFPHTTPAEKVAASLKTYVK